MTFTYHDVYLEQTATVVGPYEKKGPLKKYFDASYSDLHCKEASWEKAEVRLFKHSIDLLLKKSKLKKEQADCLIAGDLLNQITPSCYTAEEYNIPFLGIYAACATATEGLIIAANLVEAGQMNTVIVGTSSHNMTSEKQFRNPTEYGAPKPGTATFTATAGVSMLVSDEKTSRVKIESGTIGKVVDMNQKDPLNMGAVMAPAAAETLHQHLSDLDRTVEDYDMILTGDLGCIGKEIFKDYVKEEYQIDLEKTTYNDCGTMLYDLDKQKDVKAGGSGPTCSALVNASYIFNLLKTKKVKRVLWIATGALFSPTFAFQKEPILAIAHAVSLEAI